MNHMNALNAMSEEQLFTHRAKVADRAEQLQRQTPGMDVVEAMVKAESELLGRASFTSHASGNSPTMSKGTDAEVEYTLQATLDALAKQIGRAPNIRQAFLAGVLAARGHSYGNDKGTRGQRAGSWTAPQS